MDFFHVYKNLFVYKFFIFIKFFIRKKFFFNKFYQNYKMNLNSPKQNLHRSKSIDNVEL